MSKWKCEICGAEFENFHAQGFDNKIYCPLCYFKRKNQELKKQLEEKESQQKEFLEYLKNKERQFDIMGDPINSGACLGISREYKKIIGVKDVGVISNE